MFEISNRFGIVRGKRAGGGQQVVSTMWPYDITTCCVTNVV